VTDRFIGKSLSLSIQAAEKRKHDHGFHHRQHDGLGTTAASISIAEKHSGLAMKRVLRTLPDKLSEPHSPANG
jgi:hypothetical protein